MCYTSMDMSWQALQTNGKPFSNFELLLENKKENILKVSVVSIWIKILYFFKIVT